MIQKPIIFLGFVLGLAKVGKSFENEDFSEQLDMSVYQPLEEKVLNHLVEKDDGPFEKRIKKLLAEYLLASAVEMATNGSSTGIEIVGRAIPQQNNYYPPPAPGQNIVYVYGTPPPSQNQNTQRTRPTRRTKPPRTRRPGHHHQSSEERNTQPPQPVYVQAPQYPPPQQQQPPYYPQYQPQVPPQQQQPLDAPQSNLGAQSSPQQQPPAAPVQVVYLQATTPAGQVIATGPTTTPRPRPSQEHVYNQVNKILDNVAVGNVTGIVDQALGIRAPMPTRNFVNGILNTVFCNPINRLLGRCRG